MGSNGFVTPVNPHVDWLPRSQAMEFAEQAIKSLKSEGTRYDHVGIKAMCLLSGFDPEIPAVMPCGQAIATVNIITQGNRGNGKFSDESKDNSKRSSHKHDRK